MTEPRSARPFAVLWLLIVLIAGGYLGLHAWYGIAFRTDLLSLLPADTATEDTHALAGKLLEKAGRRFVLLIGHQQRESARSAASAIKKTLLEKQVASVEKINPDLLKAIGTFYSPHVGMLLSPDDRAALLSGNTEFISQRALAQIYSVGGFADAHLLRQDPFLLFPSFLAALPTALSQLTLDDGYLSTKNEDITWVLVAGQVTGDPYALDTQEEFVTALGQAIDAITLQVPGIEIKRSGAIFFAAQGSQSGLRETSTLGGIATIGTMVLLIGVFRRAGPLIMNLIAVAIGIGAGLVANLLLFGEIHIATLLFGVGLTGIAVDYGIHYSATVFDPLKPTTWERLNEILPGISLGLLTTLIGYAILLIAPFPALQQVAVFSIVGLSAAFFTVIFWFPYLDRGTAPSYGRYLLSFAYIFWRVWEHPRLRHICWVTLLILIICSAFGFQHMTVSDDVRRMQSLDPVLLAEQEEIKKLTGIGGSLQFVAISATDDEAALQRAENVADILDRLRSEGTLAAYRGPADFIPSLKRQAENQTLIGKLDWLKQVQQIGLPAAPKKEGVAIDLQQVLQHDAFTFLREWVLGPGQQVIALDDVKNPAKLRQALAGIDGVRFLDAAGDFSERLTTYRYRAIWLIGLSALLMVVPLVWRYGLKGGLTVLMPSAAALLMTPALIAFCGEPVSFFHVMGLILVLAIGVDYATFCAETDHAHRPVTMLAVLLDMATTLLSFGVLAFSSVFAVHAFGLTMLFGILIAFLLAPLAGAVNPLRRRHA